MISRRCFCHAAATGLLLGLATAKAQPQTKKVQPFCRFSLKDGWSDDAPQEYITRRATKNDVSGVPQVIARIKDSLSISAPIEVYIAEQEDNAFATVANGRRLVVVDVGFLQKLNRISRTQWGAIQVIAHEVGHHIAGFTANSHRGELNADYWSGQALQRLGAGRTAATAAILSVGTEADSASHPSKYRRADIISRGWSDAARGYVDYSYCQACR